MPLASTRHFAAHRTRSSIFTFPAFLPPFSRTPFLSSRLPVWLLLCLSWLVLWLVCLVCSFLVCVSSGCSVLVVLCSLACCWRVCLCPPSSFLFCSSLCVSCICVSVSWFLGCVLCLLSFACCVRLCSVLVSLVYGVYGVFVFSWVLCGGFLVFFVLSVACSLFALLCSFVCWLLLVSWLFIVLFVYLCWVECVFCAVVGCVVQVVFAFWVCVFGVCFGVAGCVGVFWWVAGRGF